MEGNGHVSTRKSKTIRPITLKSNTQPRHSWMAGTNQEPGASGPRSSPGGSGLYPASSNCGDPTTAGSRTWTPQESTTGTVATSPGVSLDATDAVALARDANDRLANAVRRHPSRVVRGFAALPTAAPDTAASSWSAWFVTTASKEHWINGHIRGRYLDDSSSGQSWRVRALQVRSTSSDTTSAASDCDLVHGKLRAGGGGPAGDHSLGLAHRNRDPCASPILSGAFDRYPSYSS